MDSSDRRIIRNLLDDYLRMYAGRDDRLTELFSEDFSGFTGGGDALVTDRAAWVAITRQDFAEVKDPLRLELKDLALQSLAEDVAVATSFFTIHLPIEEQILSRETARLVLIFRKEAPGWKISHSSISIPYPLVREGEIYPLKELSDRNQVLEQLVAERTREISEANAVLAREIAEHRQTEARLRESETLYRSILNASPDDITIADLEGRVLMVSPNAVPMFGFRSAADGVGRRVTDFLVPEDRERAMSRVALLFQGQAVSGPSEYRGLRQDGSTFDIEVNSALIREPDGRPTRLIVIARDITARKQTEAALQKAVAQIKTLHGLLPICMHCKKIRDDRGQWSPVEVYVRERTDAEFSHGLCPQCLAERYPGVVPDEEGHRKA
ncbi:MAG TPA: PAS domain S-box protein [Anaeromyxobacter sp.]|nr:PAS domain S-box protein [Anaeromyxobacter sp.]